MSEAIICAPTGSGKTLAYLLPILQLVEHTETGLCCVIVVPTQELCTQIMNELSFLTLNSDIIICDIASYCQKIKQSKEASKFDVLVSTPKRLSNLLEGHAELLKYVQWLVLDEGDLLLDNTQNNSFRKQVSQIYNKCEFPDIVRVIATATIHYNLEMWAKTHLYNYVKILLYQLNCQITQSLRYVGHENGRIYELVQLIYSGIRPPVLIFVNSFDQGRDLVKQLKKNNITAKIFDATSYKRSQILKDFRLGKVHFLVTTDVLSRGIDFKGVNFVINYHFPFSASIYTHRIGRTGRCGDFGNSVTFYTEDDKVLIKKILPVLEETKNMIPDWLKWSLRNRLPPQTKGAPQSRQPLSCPTLSSTAGKKTRNKHKAQFQTKAHSAKSNIGHM